MALAVPTPAHAFLGKIVDKLFGGGGEGSGACSSSDVLSMATAMAVGGPTAVVAGEIANAAGDAAGGGGCPVVEDKPLAMQELSEEQRDELIAQSEELVRMNAPTAADMGGEIVLGTLEGGDQAKAVGLEWSPAAADARFVEQHPESYAGMVPEDMAAHGDMQAREARDATRTSKRTSGAAVQDMVGNVPAELDTLMSELRACDGERGGVNCSIGVLAQMVGLAVKVGALNAVMDAAHYRADESLADVLFSAREQALQDRRLNNGEVGSAPVGARDPTPDPLPDEPPEVIPDPTVPMS